MKEIVIIDSLLSEIEAELALEFIIKDDIEKHPSFEMFKRAGFKAEQEQIFTSHESGVIYCGIDKASCELIRSAAATAIKAIKNYNYKTLSIATISQELFGAMIEGIELGGYRFEKYKSEAKEIALQEIKLSSYDSSGNRLDLEALREILDRTLIVCRATNFTKDLVNHAPQDINPVVLAAKSCALAKENNLECNILGDSEIEEESMYAMLGVSRASIHPAQLIHLSYKPENPKKVISLVGKGLTYDSGGLSLKPATSMVTMKMDKAGACAVLGIMKAASELKLDIEIHAFIGAVENMVGGNAYKPDDILKAKNGKTIEVRNTDAEGRLVLADVLGYAQEKVKADYIFDFATLTGACMVALGAYTTGVMGNNDELKNSFIAAGERGGEYCATLPFNRHLRKLLKSDIADICNISSKPYGGAITAALFLDNFIDEDMKDKWVHFDIAGSAYTEGAWDVHTYGGTGAGVRMMIEWLRDI